MASRLLLPARGVVVAERCEWATGPGERLKGLIGREGLRGGEALILSPGRQVHTFGMRDDIDVIFCSSDWSVLHVVRSMVPRRITRFLWKAKYVVELPVGGAAPVAPGDELAVEEIPA